MALARRFLGLAALLLASVGPVHALDLQSTTTPGRAVPSLTNGEIAVNRADRTLFFKNVDGSIARGALMDATAAGRKAVEQGDASGLILGTGGPTLPNALNAKAPLASPAFSGIVSAPSVALTGPGSTGPVDGMNVTAPGGSAARTLAAFIGSAQFNVPTIAALRAWPIAPLIADAGVRVSGYYAAGDEGAGNFTWSPTSTAADDGCAAIKPNGVSGAGRWVRTTKGAVISVKQCGARGGMAGNDTAAIQAAINYAESTSTPNNYWTRTTSGGVYLNPDGYFVSGIDTHLPIRMYADGPSSATLALIAGSNRSVIRAYAPPVSEDGQKGLQGSVSFEGFSIDGNAGSNTAGHGIEYVDADSRIVYSTAGRMFNMNIFGAKQHGVYVGSNRNLMMLSHSIVRNNNSNGVYINSSYDHRIVSCAIGANVDGLTIYAGAAVMISTTDIFSNLGNGLVLQNVGSMITMWGGSIGANNLNGVLATADAMNESTGLMFSGVMFADNSQATNNTSSHVTLRNMRGTFAGNFFQRGGPGATNAAKYAFDLDDASSVSATGSVYSTTLLPFVTAFTNKPAKIGTGANAAWLDFTPTYGAVTGMTVSPVAGQNRYRVQDGTLFMSTTTTFSFSGAIPSGLTPFLPPGFTAKTGATMMCRDQVAAKGLSSISIAPGNTYGYLTRYDDTAPAATNSKLVCSGQVEVQ